MGKTRRQLQLDEILINKRKPKPKSDEGHRAKIASLERISKKNELFGWAVLAALFLILQTVVSTGHYSGYGNAPKFGDFEAQRHWMEITTHLPINQWYVNSTDNDLNYWGLDYPPLTAYHSYILGKISNALNPSWVSLHTSRGIEDRSHLAFMRITVIVTMMILYCPAIILTLNSLLPKDMLFYDKAVIGAAALLYPGLIYIDNGHFQYNHIALAFFIWSIGCLLKRRYLKGSISFVLALNFKQMELYHSLPIFVFLLSKSIPSASTLINRITKTICHLTTLGIIVIGAFIALWFPFLSDADLFKQVVRRIFPFERGIFEDKVANFWCTLNVVYKLKTHLPTEILIQISLFLVLVSALPSLFLLFKRPTEKNLRLSLTITALSFFMFSYHVHEKTILMVAIPAMFLLHDHYDAVTMFLDASSFSMYALCIKDEIPEVLGLFLAYHVSMRLLSRKTSPKVQLLKSLQIVVYLAICGLQLFGNPPAKYPFLFELLNSAYSFFIFALFWLYVNYIMIGHNLAEQRSYLKASQKNKKKLQ